LIILFKTQFIMFKPVHLIHLFTYAPTLSDKVLGKTPIIGRTRLMKMLFLFEKEIFKDFNQDKKITIDFEFAPYNFGPYSKKAYEAIDFLETRDIIQISYGNRINESDFELENFLNLANETEANFEVTDEEIRVEQFSITEYGIKLMKDKSKFFAWINLTPNQQLVLTKFKSQMVNSRLKDILIYVYKKYPEYAEKSQIKNQLFID
jgi:uncharacterized protein